VVCDERDRRVTISQNVGGKQQDRTFRFDMVRAGGPSSSPYLSTFAISVHKSVVLTGFASVGGH